MTQEPLPLRTTTRIDQAEIVRPLVYNWLEDGSWHTSKSFERKWNTGERIIGLDRLLRIVAERSQGQIISGQKGYKLTKYATTEEIDHAERWLLSQASKMKARAVEIRKCRNAGGRAA